MEYRVKRIDEQIGILRCFFNNIDFNYENSSRGYCTLPSGAEGLFVIPLWEKIASNYNDALKIVLSALNVQRKGKFYNWRWDCLDKKYLRIHKHTVLSLHLIKDQQPGQDILIVPAQFGFHHRGQSVSDLRNVFVANEFGLGAFAVGIMLLTHPERLESCKDLGINCGGDEYAPVLDFSHAPYFSLDDEDVNFGARQIDKGHDHFGTASAFFK